MAASVKGALAGVVGGGPVIAAGSPSPLLPSMRRFRNDRRYGSGLRRCRGSGDARRKRDRAADRRCDESVTGVMASLSRARLRAMAGPRFLTKGRDRGPPSGVRETTMTQEQKITRAKVGLLELAKQLGNVIQACKMMGRSRDSFYRFKELSIRAARWRCRNQP
jgi:hypothetical protein